MPPHEEPSTLSTAPATPSGSGTSTPSRSHNLKLDYRMATKDDLPLLRQYREECGWGLERLEKNWEDPDRPLCVLILEDENNGERKEIGMGGWILEMEDELDAACKKDGIVQLTALFIQHQYHRLGLGNLALDLLEQVAAERYNARFVTLDTMSWDYQPREDGVYMEVVGTESRNMRWYRRRGYEVYKPNKPKYVDPKPWDPNYMVSASFMKKAVSA